MKSRTIAAALRNRQTVFAAVAIVVLAGAFSACSMLGNDSTSDSSNLNADFKHVPYKRHEKKN